MKNIAAIALMLTLGVAGVYAQEKPVTMRYSGTEGKSAIDLQIPGTQTAEFNFAGNGTLGPFTFRNVEADGASPQQSSACPATQLYVQTMAGAGVFRFQDGSLLKVNLTEGHDCIDFVALEAHCTRTFKITGGTCRFKAASGGILTLTETVVPVLFDFLNNPVFFSATGDFTGTISGVSVMDERHDTSEKTR
jgi:hypothetical protein